MSQIQQIDQEIVYSFLEYLNKTSADYQEIKNKQQELHTVKEILSSLFQIDLNNEKDKTRLSKKENSLTSIWKEKFPQKDPQPKQKTQETPKSNEKNPKELAKEFKEKGNTFLKSKKYNEAIECYTKAISIDPENSIYYSNRAVAYNQLHQHLKAIEDCKISILKNANYSKVYTHLGYAYLRLSLFKKALDEGYQRAFDLEPKNENYKKYINICKKKLEQQKNFQKTKKNNLNLKGKKNPKNVKNSNTNGGIDTKKIFEDFVDQKNGKLPKFQEEINVNNPNLKNINLNPKLAKSQQKGGTFENITMNDVISNTKAVEFVEEFMNDSKNSKTIKDGIKKPETLKKFQLPKESLNRLQDPNFLEKMRNTPQFQDMRKNPLFNKILQNFEKDPMAIFKDSNSIQFLKNFESTWNKVSDQEKKKTNRESKKDKVNGNEKEKKIEKEMEKEMEKDNKNEKK
ncbi:hypothetical protein M0813_10656 [Anaeramoeba flamelloides]|uniref:Uncharacterized protein n=1 Tax=Anaeramoeba flamelloides TaxID=1746091 RepID=A0ABQ8X2K6_9EUKA|nr:hypothetical protein M0813_10656 [Anaeramoeba flamelloides]